ncbi:uncharacterized protein PRCAT00003949001 [Priceomyces carsonii]|uniref:uncharacterized protein n=1 Tax=Priceomyces carsonii TaxID=28549 RepID=UPI002ED8074B|nr:unnamed protein product [Priceomyces carsonii]
MVDFIKYQGFDHVFQYSGPWLWWLVGFYLCLPILAYIILPYLGSKGTFSGKKRTISIFVMGDLGHSPRMCYHAKSFSKLNYYVNLCGYLQSEPPAEIVDDINIEIHLIPLTENRAGLPFALFAVKKIILQIFQLFSMLFEFRGSEYILIQNPPSIPILVVAIIFIKLFSRNTQLVVDWHNLNYTILNLRYNNLKHPAVRALRLYEKFFSRFVSFNLTVTKCLKSFLVNEFSIDNKKILTVYDRPANQFKPLDSSGTTKNEIMNKSQFFDGAKDLSEYKILVSSTSFTADEDFSILLDALKIWDKSSTKLPKLLLIVTGKGPMKGEFLDKVRQLNFSESIVIKTAWLSSEDYPNVLSIADVGISLHSSSSGLDLPMKIVDFFGCGVPVISLKFPAIGELVKQGINGLIVEDVNETGRSQAESMERLLENVLTDPKLLRDLKVGALEESYIRWDEHWNAKMGPKFRYQI